MPGSEGCSSGRVRPRGTSGNFGLRGENVAALSNNFVLLEKVMVYSNWQDREVQAIRSRSEIIWHHSAALPDDLMLLEYILELAG